MARIQGYTPRWVFITVALTVLCFQPSLPYHQGSSLMWPTYTEMSLSKAIEILHNLGIVVDTEEKKTNYLESSNQLTRAYDTLHKHLVSHSRHCNASERFRSADGSCNNLKNPLWGASLHTQRRLLPNAYLDGWVMDTGHGDFLERVTGYKLLSLGNKKAVQSAFVDYLALLANARCTAFLVKRAEINSDSWFECPNLTTRNQICTGKGVPRLTGKDGYYLSSARTISLECFPETHERDEDLDKETTQMHMQWGQYIDHDLIFTELMDGSNCCADPRNTFIHPHIFTGGPCFPIQIPPGDRFFTGGCMPFRRSFNLLVKGVREQINGISSYVDATTVYGSTLEQQEFLRTHRGGLLKVSAGNNLPLQGNFKCIPDVVKQCVYAGDSRVSVFTGLTVFHTVFHREHNRVAGELAKVNPHWDNERLFQEARKIVIAIHQKIVYDDYLPLVIGRDVMSIFGIDQPFVYDPEIDASIINSFGAAAFRFGHSQVTPDLKINGTVRPISQLFFRSQIVFNEDIMKEVIVEQAKGLAQKTNEGFSTEVTDLLFFGVDAQNLSTDLGARNIQRGRDHGIPAYLKFFDFCREKMGYLPVVNEFNLPVCLTSDVYDSVYDVDLFVGGLYEYPLQDALVGPTFACLIAEQFWRLKFGDRFFYENNDPYIGFSPDKVLEIKKTSLTTVLCQNSEVRRLQPNAFKPGKKPHNAVKPCSRYDDIDFTKWIESPFEHQHSSHSHSSSTPAHSHDDT